MAYTAINKNSMAFEVRTTGSDTNGGGFGTAAAGADFSQADSNNLAANNTTTTLAAAITTTGATSCTLTSVTALYKGLQTTLVGDWIEIDSEILKVSAANTGTGVCTIARGQLGTSAATHLISATVTNISNVSTTDLATAGSTTITTATGYLSANAVGNVVYISGGSQSIVSNWYYIVSVSTSGSNTTAVVDRSTGLTASGTGATFNIGGALASPSIGVGLHGGTGGAVYIKAGSGYTFSTASTFTAGGCCTSSQTVNTFINIIGYTSTRTDGGYATCTLSTGSAIMFGNNGSTLFLANLILNVNSQTSSAGIQVTTGATSAYNCHVSNFTTYGLYTPTNMAGKYILCSATGGSGTVGIEALSVIACESYSNTCPGFIVGNMAVNCLSYNNTGSSSYGFNCSPSGTSLPVINCIAYGNGSYGFYRGDCVNCYAEGNGVTTSSGGYSVYAGTDPLLNCFAYNNTGGAVAHQGNATVAPFQQTSSVTALSSSAFVNAGSSNFAINNTASAGALMRAAGIPGTFPSGNTKGYLDAGAVQHKDSGGSTGFFIQ